jgi:hypothetical protein
MFYPENEAFTYQAKRKGIMKFVEYRLKVRETFLVKMIITRF